MVWPDDAAYSEAIQNPQLCFRDPELSNGTVVTLPTGLPKVVSGNFASVYQIRCLQRTYAVRCFRRQITDQRVRYQAIGEHLQRIRLPYFVGCAFLNEGIRVRGLWYPVVKMEWVAGKPLDQYVQQNLKRAEVLLQLAAKWLEMMCALENASIAHGDLQNGNVLVVGGNLKLIDYDGMYVPRLAAHAAGELGHADFQHPARSSSDFGAELDRFSSWVIFTSLLALAVAPYLWERLEAGGDRLLFSRQDFANPTSSRALSALRDSELPLLRTLAEEVATSLRASPRNVRPLRVEYLKLAEVSRKPGGTSTPSHAGGSSLRRGIPEWLSDLLVEAIPATPATFAGVFLLERFLVLLLMLTLVVSVCSVALGAVHPSAPQLVVGSNLSLTLYIFVRRYLSSDVVREKLRCAASLKTAYREKRHAEYAIEQLERKLGCEDDRYHKSLSVLRRRLTEAQQKQHAEVARVQREVDADVTRLANEKRRVMEEQALQLQAAESEANTRLAALANERNGLQAEEQAELASVLRRLNQEHVMAFLKQQWLVSARLPSVGKELKARLQNVGIYTAADVSQDGVQRVRGIGPQRARTLVEWRRSLENRALASAPQIMPAAEAERIRQDFARRAQELLSQMENCRRRLEVTRRDIQHRYEMQLSQLEKSLERARRDGNDRLSQVRDKYLNEERRINAELTNINRQHAAARRVIEDKRTNLETALSQARIAVAKKSRECERFGKITFLNYVRSITGLQRKGRGKT